MSDNQQRVQLPTRFACHKRVVLAESGDSRRLILPCIAKLMAQISHRPSANVSYEQSGANGSRNAGEPVAILGKLLAHGL
jgi:hypothetical protein